VETAIEDNLWSDSDTDDSLLVMMLGEGEEDGGVDDDESAANWSEMDFWFGI
jgi:hypothetical protein